MALSRQTAAYRHRNYQYLCARKNRNREQKRPITVREGKDILLGKLRSSEGMTRGEQIRLTFLLALPSIFAQLSSCLMSYIDAAMVGALGSAQAAAVGLVSTTTWIFGSFCYANSSGFSVQMAHKCGSKDFAAARAVFRLGIRSVFLFSLALAALGLAISQALPRWLGGEELLWKDASAYFAIYAAFLPVLQVENFCVMSLVASGNTKISGLASIAMCLLDVVFNYIFIYMLGLGVAGAAIGTGLAILCAGVFLLYYILCRSRELGVRGRSGARDSGSQDGIEDAGSREGCTGGCGGGDCCPEAGEGSSAEQRFSRPSVELVLSNALKITAPLWLQNLVSRGAYIIATVLIAPLGTIAVAANSFAIIAEGFCYLPGYGMQDAATSLVGQSLGAKKPELARGFARISIFSGAAMMGALALIMWITAPAIMGMLSSDPEVIGLGARCLRIEAWAEILYGVSIVAYGCCVGAGDTLVPSLINLICMWAVRIGLSLLLIPHFGLEGYWIAMATELCLKGLIFAARIRSGRWMRSGLFAKVR